MNRWRLSLRVAASDHLAIISTAVAFALIVVGLAVCREGWMDEFITYTYTNPLRSAFDLYTAYWAGEPSAPTYYLALWAWRKLIPPFGDLASVRLLSVLASLLLIATSLLAYDRLVRSRLGVFAAFLLCSPPLIFFAEEARSYVFSFFGGVFIGIAFLAALSSEHGAEGRSLFTIALTGAFGSLLCSVHLVSVMVAAFCLLSLAAIAMRRRDWRIAILSAALAAFALLPGAAPTLLLTSGVPSAVKVFWITRWFVLQSILWLPALLGVPTVVLIVTVISNRWIKRASLEPLLRPAIYALATAFAFLLLAFVFSMLKPVLTLRYLAAWVGFLIPATAFVAAWAISELSQSWKKVAVFAVIPCLIADTAAALATPHHPGAWREPGLYVRSLPSCRSTVIPVVLLTFVPAEGAWADMFAWYAGGPDRFVPATEENLNRAAAQSCPVRLWAAHLIPRYLSPAVQNAFVKSCQDNAVEVLTFDGGYLFVDAADREALSHWTGSRSTCAAVKQSLL